MFENSTENIMEAKSGNQEVMTKLIENNSKLIWSIVIRFKDRGHELQDLYQIGCIGLLKAIKGFDSKYEVKLSTYAVPFILGEVKRFLRDDGIIKVSRSAKELLVKIRMIQKDCYDKTGKDINIDEISKILKVSKEEVAFALESSVGVDSIDNKDEDGFCIGDKIPCNENQEESIINRITIKDLLNSLDDKSRTLIMLRYFKGKTQCEVARILNMSQVQVSRLEKKILNKMKEF